MVLLNGKVVTLDENETIAEALSAKLGKITAIGTSAEIREWVGPDTEVIDADGRTVIPGLIDSHAHLTRSASRRSLDLSEEAGIISIADIQRKISEKAKTIPEGMGIFGSGEDDYKLAEKRHPTRWELDEAAPSHPVIISTVGGHFSIANSKALELAGVTRGTPDPVGGEFDRDSETGELTGGLHESAVGIVRRAVPVDRRQPSREDHEAAMEKLLHELAATGLTCIYDNVGRSQINAVMSLKNKGRLPIRFRVDIGIDNFEELSTIGMTHYPFGDEWVKICGLKFFFDGAISARTAYVSEPYLHKQDFYGVLATTPEIAAQRILDAYAAGCRISAHANGDRAIEMYLDIMEEAQTKHPREDPRNRIIHCTVVNPAIVNRIKSLDMLPTIFGAYPYYHGDKLLPAFGEKRLESMFAARSFLDAGIKVAAHSDYGASPYRPLMGIHALVNRTTKSGKAVGASQKVSVKEALKLYTVHSAYQSFDEDTLGSLEVGKYADMVVLGADLLTVPKDTIIDIPVHKTIVSGKLVFEKK
jgi:predicted amidohydrolase YtcJ